MNKKDKYLEVDYLGKIVEGKLRDMSKFPFFVVRKIQVKTKLQTEVEKNGNYGKVKEVVNEFITNVLEKIASGAREAAKGATTDTVIGNATSAGHGATPADKASVVSLVKGIKEIVGVVLKEQGDAGATKTGEDDKKKVGNLFAEATNKDESKEENIAKAVASIGAVSGADILKAIAVSKENPVADSTDGIEKATDAAEIAIAPAVNDKKEIKDSAKKDAVIAGGIALRGMAKDGKLAVKEEKSAHAVNGAVASAVGKVLSTLVVAIRETVDSGLKRIKEELGKVKEEDRVESIVNQTS